MKSYLTRILGFILSGAMKGGSLVVRDGKHAIKVFRPKPTVRLIYFLFYGRISSYYETLYGVYRARLLRAIANYVTTLAPEFGRPVFAKPIAVRFYEKKPALVLEWIDGEPITKMVAREFQLLLEQVLLDSGLPTWSINIQNPGAYHDMRRTANGNIIALDYESALPPLFVSRKERARMQKAGLWFPIDWVDHERLEQTLIAAEAQEYSELVVQFRSDVQALQSFDKRRFPWSPKQRRAGDTLTTLS